MPERRRRKKAKSRPSRTKKPAKRSSRARRPAGPDRDVAVLRSLILLSVGDCLEFADHRWPPENICRWLAEADLRQVRGMLLATLERWHELHPEDIGDAR